ncbi:MAG: hypothetical protein LBE99_03410 [Puniceicoccales bacterium]|nr:hypothetical protein [Puniceicoccales bacterium]
MKNIIQTITAVSLMMGTVSLNAWRCDFCDEEHADVPGSYCPKSCLEYCPDCAGQHVLSHCPKEYPITFEKGEEARRGFFQCLNWFDLRGAVDDIEAFLNVFLSTVCSKGGIIRMEGNVLRITDDGLPRSGLVGVNQIDTGDFRQHPQFGTGLLSMSVPTCNDIPPDDVATKKAIYEKGFEYLHWLDLCGSKNDFEDVLTRCVNMITVKGGKVFIYNTGDFLSIRTSERSMSSHNMLLLPPFVRPAWGKIEISCREVKFVGKSVFSSIESEE